MLTKEDILIQEVPKLDSAEEAAGHGRKFQAIINKSWEGFIPKLVCGTAMEDKVEAELCVSLHNEAMVDVYQDFIRAFGEVVGVAKEYKNLLPDELMGAIEQCHDKLEDTIVLTQR